MNFKRKGPKSTRAGCLLCKPQKHQAESHRERAKAKRSWRRFEDAPASAAAADAMEERATALDAYAESLPDGVTTDAFAEASNLRREARRLRAAADEPGETPA